MRIACVHVPQFALQSLGRVDPSLRGAAVAVVGAGHDPAGGRPSLALHSPIVLACSRAAWTLGVRLGMTAGAARFVSPELRVVVAAAQCERETVRALADALLGLSPVVDAGGRVAGSGVHLAMYCEVPSKVRSVAFGERLIDLLAAFGVAARVGIADDRFTAWVAAAHGGDAAGASVGGGSMAEGSPHVAQVSSARVRGRRSASRRDAGGSADAGAASAASAASVERVAPPVAAGMAPPVVAGRRRSASRHGAAPTERCVVSVPRGGSAAFLAPRPLSLLAITPEVQHMLEALGVRTLGAFAALPAPSVARPLEADYQALARGDSGHALRPYTPAAPIREDVVAGAPGGLFGDAALVATLARRVALRLAGRSRRAVQLEVVLGGDAGERVLSVSPARALAGEDELVAAIAPLVERGGAVSRLGLVVVAEVVAAEADAAAEVAHRGSIDGAADAAADGPVDCSVDALAVALSNAATPAASSTPRGQSWQLIAPHGLPSEPHDSHRRTRRARPLRRIATAIQPPLFGKLEG